MDKPNVSQEKEIMDLINSYSDEEFYVFCEQIMQCNSFCIHVNSYRPFTSMRALAQVMTGCLDGLSTLSKLIFLKMYNSFLDEFFTNVRDMEIMNIRFEEENVEYAMIRHALNSYKERFGFNFIMNPSRRTLGQIYQEIIRRLTLSFEEVINEVIKEIKSIITDRLSSLQLSYSGS